MFLLLLFVAIGLLMVGLAIPLIQGKVPPNHWYGFRIRLTLENPDIWYPANAYAGWGLLACGLVTILTAAAGTLIPNLSQDGYSVLVSAVMLISLMISLLMSWRYAKSLAGGR